MTISLVLPPLATLLRCRFTSCRISHGQHRRRLYTHNSIQKLRVAIQKRLRAGNNPLGIVLSDQWDRCSEKLLEGLCDEEATFVEPVREGPFGF